MTERPVRPLVGREDDLAVLVAALGAARQGRMASVFLTGEAGVGKTRLVQELVAMAEGDGDDPATVLLGGASDIAESPPFWPVTSALRTLLRAPRGERARQLLAPLSDELDELLVPRSVTAAPPQRVQTLELLHRVALRLSTSSVLVLVVEDMQWADRSTLDLLAYLVANLPEERLLLLGTLRTEPGTEPSAARTVVRELGRHRQVRCTEVAPLHRTAVAELVRVQAPDRGDLADLVELVWKRSVGNAFIAEETLRAALDGDPTALPATLRELVLSRVDQLSAPALRAVRAIGLCDGPLPHRLLDAVLEGGSWLLPALREAVDAGVAVVDPATDGYRLRHGLMTDVVVGELLPGERIELHRRYATALESPWARELPGVDARRAHHWHGAGDRERAAAAAVVAAESAERVRGYAEAHRHWLRAARTVDEQGAPVPRSTCLERAAEAAHLAGDADQAVALLDERLGLLDPPDVASSADLEAALLHARTGQYLVAAGRGAEAAEAFARATAALPSEGAERERAEVLGGHASALWTAGDLAAAHEAAERALALARRIGHAGQEARALATLGFGRAYRQDPEAGEKALRESIAVAERAGEPGEIARAYRSLAELLSGPLNDLERGITIAREGVERVRELGLLRSAGAGLLAVAANGLFRLGRWDDAVATIAEAWELAPSGAEALELRLARARLDIGRGRFAAAEDDLEAVDALSAATVGPRYRLPLLTLQAGLAMWQSRPDLALDHVAAGLDVVEQGSDDVWLVAPLVWHGARARAELTRLGMRRVSDGIDNRLHRHTAELARKAAASAPAVRQVVVGFLEMSAAEDGRAAGRSDPQAWERVAELWQELHQPYPAAYAHLRRAEALLATRANSAAAAEALRRAAGVAQRMGATPFLTEIVDLGQRARVNLDASTPAGPQLTATAPDELGALTARELEVLTELARGHTNREIAQRLFISEKTVGVHITRIYAKLGVRSRVQASAVLFRARPALREQVRAARVPAPPGVPPAGRPGP